MLTKGKQRLHILLFSFLASGLSHADDPAGGYFFDYKENCPEIKYHAESNRISCNEITRTKATEELTSVYDALIKYGSDEQRRHIEAMQQAWLDLKKAQCGLMQTYYADVIYEKWTSMCEAAMTITRVKELRQLGTGIMRHADEDK